MARFIFRSQAKDDRNRIILRIAEFYRGLKRHNGQTSMMHSVFWPCMSKCNALCNDNIGAKLFDDLDHCLYVRGIKAAFLKEWLRSQPYCCSPILCILMKQNPSVRKNVFQIHKVPLFPAQ